MTNYDNNMDQLKPGNDATDNLSDAANDNNEKYSLNDDRRVKVLTPGALVAKRFFRNRIAVVGMGILIFMFLFSFVGGIISPYGQDQFFYRDEDQHKNFGAVILNDELRYSARDDKLFGSVAQAQTILAITKGQDSFRYSDVDYTVKKEGEDFYSIYTGNDIVGIAYKDIISSTTGKDSFDFDFKYAALKSYLSEADDATFEAGGASYSIDEHGNILDSNGTEIAYIGRYIVNAVMGDVTLSRDFKDKLIATIEAGEDKFTYTDESLIIHDENENVSQEEDGLVMEDAAGLVSDDAINQSEQTDSATAEYDISYDAGKKTWNILQSQSAYKYDTYSKPSKSHWLGTDKYGMDMITRLMYGGRVSLLIGFIVIIIETVLGIIMGGLAGYFGGWVDNIIMRAVDVFYCLPSMPIIIILGAAMDAQRVDPTLRMVYLMLILGVLGWAGIARLVRGQILSIREQEFMIATEATGIRVSSRIFKHLIPNVIPQLIVNCTMGLGNVIITEATLSFLGLGVKFPFASWGNIINDVNNTFVLTTYWFIWIPAGILLLLTVLAFNLVGDGLRDAFDPRMKR